MLIDTQVKLDYSDVLLRPKRSNIAEDVNSRNSVTIGREFNCVNSGQVFSCVPIIASNMDTVGTFEMAKALSQFDCMTAIHKFYSLNDIFDYMENCDSSILRNIFISIGSQNSDKKKIRNINSIYKKGNGLKICIDSANGYLQSFVKFVEFTRNTLPEAVIMAGNIATREMAEQLILSGVDIVKVGIGPGSVCLTRKMTGVGYPQLSAVIECAEAAHGLGGLICADGGCEVPGDIVKAFGGGADFVMLGGLLAAHEECHIYKDEDGKVDFYGMSSRKAMLENYGEYAEYRASEGREVKLKYRGSVVPFIQHDILGGLRSGMTLIGAKRLKDIPKRAEFVLTNKQLNRVYEQYETKEL